ncbi:helix-turn-helix domain-containing protein [Streptomyces sp. NBC_00503]|uniref:helix-turn-helix domain-containing protein n=1 Tax=Streptomyces sp. NBC_00503 TaxID=2903659 RepID=UPI002E80125A|nr:helix-turn-helix domain-containing protein [Streptomyces sp. NBC_00503]WUD81944.1 helix-turn-helix domain-containing protein [Streptomyces sp. NBC_00503]
MSAVARILGIYIQSLPAGTPIGIKELVKQLPLGETSIANGLRELVAFGYLERSVETLPGGRIVTRTVSYNHPRAALSRPGAGVTPSTRAGDPPPSSPERPLEPGPEPVAAPAAVAVAAPVRKPLPAPAPAPVPEPKPEPEPEPEPLAEPVVAPEPVRVPALAVGEEPGPEQPAAGRVPVPLNADDPERHRLACEVLAGLRRASPRLVLGERDIRYLAGGVEAWLERGVGVYALVTALTAKLPGDLRNPTGLIAHRLAAQLPPPLAPLPRAPDFVPPDPFQTCTACDRAYRSPTPGTCKGCRPAEEEAEEVEQASAAGQVADGD